MRTNRSHLPDLRDHPATLGCRVKIERASETHRVLAAEIKEWIEGEPCVVERTTFPDSSWEIRLLVKSPPPQRWGAMVGEIVHNLRSALDLLAVQLVLAGGGQPQRSTCFPIAENRQKFMKMIGTSMAGASTRAHRITELLRPYSGGNDALWCLHQLDIRDKHHLLMPVVMSQPEVGAIFRMFDDPIAEAERIRNVEPLWLIPRDFARQASEGSVLMRSDSGAATVGKMPLAQLHFFLEPALTFPDEGVPVEQVLKDIEGVRVERLLKNIL